jgi:hypothetical protein
MRNVLLIVLTFLTVFTTLNAQEQGHNGCGIELGPESRVYFERTAPSWQQFLASYGENIENRSANYIPVKAHIVRRNDGTGGLSTASLNMAIAEANAFYINANIQFFLCGSINYINSNTYYNFDKSEEDALVASHYVNNALNIYFMGNVTNGSSGLCGYAHFPWIANDVVVMDNECTLNGSTFVHELGHYFSLLHTHEPFYGNELVDGSNCDAAGDLICDTPADPRLWSSATGYLVNTDCEYTGTATDANGDAYDPDPHNIMSYSHKHCRDLFTEGQYARIAFSAQNDRDHLICGSEYCTSSGNNAVTSYIESVQMGTIGQVSGLNNGYGNFTDVSTVLKTGTIQNFSLMPAVTGASYTAYWRIWIDYNLDNDFNDSGELVFSSTQSVGELSASPVAGTFLVPSGATNGPARMRIAMRVGAYPVACGNYTIGETEDYTVYLEDGYCGAQANSTAYEWIESVKLGNMLNESGPDNGYGNYTNQIATVVPGETYPLILNPGFAGAEYNESWRVWIDYNQDGDFNDAGEEVLTDSGTSAVVTSSITIPAGTLMGCTQMRVSMKYGIPSGPCEAYAWGEVEDYTINVAPAYCTAVGNNTSYEFIDRMIFKTADNTLLAPHMVDHTSGNNSGYGDFTNIVIPVQQGLSYPFVAVPGFVGSSYSEYWKAWVDYNQDGVFDNDEELILQAGPTSASVGGFLHFGTDAELGCTRMRIAMSYGSSFGACGSHSYGEVEDYTIMVLPMAIGADTEGEVVSALEVPEPIVYPGLEADRPANDISLTLHPNPTKQQTQVNLDLLVPGTYELKVLSATGQEVYRKTVAGEGTIKQMINCSAWPEGLYLVQLSNEGQQFSQRLIVTK